MKRFISLVISVLLVMTVYIPAYAEDGGHVIINQIYGASDDGYASHSFIELYNSGNKPVNLNGWSVQYRSSAGGNQPDSWAVCKLTGVIDAYGYYLIRCGATAKPSGSYQVPEGNQEWNISLHNKGISVALISTDKPLTDDFSGDVTRTGFAVPEGFEDLAAVQGNDGTKMQIPPAYEGGYAAIQSKKKAIRRINFTDTNNNAADFEEINYSKAVSADNGPHRGNDVIIPGFEPVVAGNKQYKGFFDDKSSVKAKLIARYNAGAYSVDGGSAEITAYNAENGFAYSVNGVKGTLDCIDMRNLSYGETVSSLSGTELDAAALAASADAKFNYGDLTSAAVSPDGSMLAVSMQDADYTKPGKVLLFKCNKDGSLSFTGIAAVGVQPDMVVFTEDGQKVLTADEGEPRQGYSMVQAVDPKGSVTVVDVEALTSEIIDFTDFDTKRNELIAAGIVLKKNTAPSLDLEPEYIAVNGNKAYVALQEANAVAVLNLDSLKFENIWSLGFEDYSRVDIDLNKSDGIYAPARYSGLKGIRMPDGIACTVINGETYLLTANEGDSRAWPAGIESDANEIKSKTSPVNGIKTGGKVTWFDVSQYDGLEQNTDYVFGGRSFTIFKVTERGLSEVYDSGSDFEHITNNVLKNYFNCSNDTIEADDRSGKKGPEPENVTVGASDGHFYAFIGLERIGGIMMYDITDPSNAVFKNYINSRDFSADIQDDVSPEGIIFVAADKNNAGVPLVVASNEVSGTVSVMALGFDNVPPEILNIEDGATYYTTKKVVVYKDDEQPVTVSLNGETVESAFLLKGNCEAVYEITATDSVGNKAVCTVYMKPISSITDSIKGITSENVTSDNRNDIEKTEMKLMSVAESFDEAESTDEEFWQLADGLNKCRILGDRIDDIQKEIERITDEAGKYSEDTVTKDDEGGLQDLAADAKALLETSNLTVNEREKLGSLTEKLSALLNKLHGSESKPEISTGAEKNEERQPASGAAEASLNTGDASHPVLWLVLIIASAVTSAAVYISKGKRKKN